jgi:chemotaxis protein methyltransferase WspC
MSRATLLELLRTRIGLDAESLGERIIEDAFADARRALAASDDEQLLRKVLFDQAAFTLAAEHFLVPESWFFRADEQFADVVRFALANRGRRPLRILSLPCASGEEAYSVVIRLMEAGLGPGEIAVTGLDLSAPSIARARAGHYRRSALRGQDLVEPWLEPAGDGFRVAELVRGCVQFRVGNALDDPLLNGSGRFDVVFCRNLLIYLHGDARMQLLARLRALLAEPGLLLAGHAEVVSSMHEEFQPLPDGSPLSFRVRTRQDPAPAPAVPMPAAPRAPSPPPSLPPPPARVDATSPVATGTPRGGLARARALADAGRLADAHADILHWLEGNPVDAEAWYLLGLIESAGGRFDAADEAFVRVLYLDRAHEEALAQRIGLAERLGHRDQARELRARAARQRGARP